MGSLFGCPNILLIVAASGASAQRVRQQRPPRHRNTIRPTIAAAHQQPQQLSICP
jgi:hypothetical protein